MADNTEYVREEFSSNKARALLTPEEKDAEMFQIKLINSLTGYVVDNIEIDKSKAEDMASDVRGWTDIIRKNAETMAATLVLTERLINFAQRLLDSGQFHGTNVEVLAKSIYKRPALFHQVPMNDILDNLSQGNRTPNMDNKITADILRYLFYIEANTRS